MFITTKSYVGDPIDCYVPKEFVSNWIKYTDNYCWVRDRITKSFPAPPPPSSVFEKVNPLKIAV